MIGVGSAVPSRVITNADITELVDTSDEWITSRTGIKARRVINEDETGSALAAAAAKDALAFADLDPKEIDLIIVATSTPDNLYPSTACMVQAEIGASRAASFDIEAACTGIIYALATARQFIATGMYKTVLVCGMDIHSRFLDWEDRNTCILFGDGAGAFLLQACEENEFLSAYLRADGTGGHLLKIENTGVNYPKKGIEQARPTHRFLQMKGKPVYEFAITAVPEAVRMACQKAQINISDLDYIVPHQANERIIKAAADRLGMKLEQFVTNIADFGNTSAASIPLAFTEAVRQDILPTKSTIAMVGFGAGLTWGSSIIKWNAVDKRKSAAAREENTASGKIK